MTAIMTLVSGPLYGALAQPRLMDCAGREPLPSMCIVPLSQPGDARLARDYQAAG